jgi:NADH dehydrogenase (ubiquinone) Fe-S protein 3|tara:strand:+ start:391 stop:966 length:576 start_codon:yes stop_codon:yes gene_type:complete
MKNKTIIFKNLKNLSKVCPLEKIQVFNDNIILVVKPKLLFDVLLFLNNSILHQFKILTSISGVDYPMNRFRFNVVYELLSIRFNYRLRIKTFTHELLNLESCEKIYPAANWYECEIWDLYGIFFKNHSNLKRILTDYGFEGFPLRKDFPLSGFVEMRYNEIEKRVITESLELCQEYRTFDFFSPWETQKNL